MDYQAPVEEIKFALHQEAGFERLIESGAYPDLSTDLLDAILTEAAKFADDIIAPLNRLGDRKHPQLTDEGVHMPAEFTQAYQHYVASGWSTLAAPSEYGGQGLPLALSNAVTEMMNSNISFQLCPMLSNGGMEALSAHASEEQKQKYLHKVVSGAWSATMNLTEPQAGSDVGAIKTKAIPQTDGSYKITGTKIFITYGDHDMAENIIHLVLARTPEAPAGTKGISLFVVPKFFVQEDGTLGARNDVRCIGLEQKLGIHASPTCVMAFGETGGATGWLIGAEGKGMACMFTMMNNARLHVGLQGVGIAEAATQKAFHYARERKQGRAIDAAKTDHNAVSIIAHPDIQRSLMTMRCLTDAARALCYENAIMADMAHSQKDEHAKLKNDLLTPLSKAFSTDIANEVAAIGVNIHGGMGFMEETGAAQFVRDARILTIYEGTNGIQAMDLVGRKLPLKDGAIAQSFIDEMRETARQCRKSNHALLSQTGKQLDDALDTLCDVNTWLLTQLKSGNQKAAMTGATPYLRLFALCAGGHYLARGGLACMQNTSNFSTRKITSAHFFALNFLSTHKGFATAITAGSLADALGFESFIA